MTSDIESILKRLNRKELLELAHNKKINIHDEASTMGFASIPTHVEKADYFRKFDPKMSE